ncbi:MAG: UDP-N-acetylmuramoyl-L-alanyl-D-glutamate--2,6-diaminopimelate ligase [Phycisphaerales bacterium]
MTLEELIAGLDLRRINQGVGLGDVRVCDLTEDSRTAVPGSLFVARVGTRTNGARFIKPAIDCGCVAIITDHDDVLVDLELQIGARRLEQIPILVSDQIQRDAGLIAERFYGHPGRALICAGVTGTNGKTTIAHLCQQLIESAGVRCGLIGTVEIDDGRERSRAAMTTPPAIELSRTLATMVEHGCKAVVMEVSSHALDQQRAGAIGFDAAAFTNLTGDHFDYHETIEHYTQSKSKLFGLLNPNGLAAINMSDPNDSSAAIMIDSCTPGAQIVRCGDGCQSSVMIEEESIEGMTLRVRTPMAEYRKRVPIFGAYNASNILQSVLMAEHVLGKMGIESGQIRESIVLALGGLQLPPGRLERVGHDEDDIRVFVDFAHTDDALSHALDAVNRVKLFGSELWCVFGCGGDRDTTKRPRMGRVASERAEHLVMTSDNPRTEPPNRILDEIIAGVDSSLRSKITVQSDRARAIEYAIVSAKPGDVVLIAGKGHETEQISPDGQGGVRTQHFDDREHALVALRQRRLRFPAQADES